MIKHVIDGVSKKLSDSFKDMRVYTSNVEQGLKEPCFFVALIKSNRNQIRGSLYADSDSVVVHYIPRDSDELEDIVVVLESLYAVLEYIPFRDGSIRGIEMSGQIADNAAHFYVKYDAHVIYESKKEESMENITANTGLKENKNG